MLQTVDEGSEEIDVLGFDRGELEGIVRLVLRLCRDI